MHDAGPMTPGNGADELLMAPSHAGSSGDDDAESLTSLPPFPSHPGGKTLRFAGLRLSAEVLVTGLVLFVTMVGSYVSLSIKVDNLITIVARESARTTDVERELQNHRLLPIHPVARAELDAAVARIDRMEHRIDMLEIWRKQDEPPKRP